MPEKRYSSDWAKSKSRALVKGMIERTLLKFRKPQELRVLCFPGIDAAEIFEVYDTLGIPRSNIIGVEREKEVAKAIREKNLGITLEETTIEDYVQREERLAFDIVSLDYIGPLSHKEITTIKQVTAKQRRNHFLLHTANLLRRDRSTRSLYVYAHTLADNHLTKDEKICIPLDLSEKIKSRFEDIIQKVTEQTPWMDEKKQSYSILMKAAYCGATLECCNNYFRFAAGDDLEQILRLCEDRIEKSLGQKIRLCEESPFGTESEDSYYHKTTYPIIQNLLESMIYLMTEYECKKNRLIGEDIIFLAWIMIAEAAKTQKAYRAKDACCYSYISESGAPMIGDINFLSYPSRQIEISREFARLAGYPSRMKIAPSKLAQAYGLMADYAKATAKFSSPEEIEHVAEAIKNRIFLGNSSRPVITKARAIEEFRQGATADDIKEKYRGVNGKPLSQWKAHVTMGTYDPAAHADNGEDDSDLEKITKDEAIDLLASGIPVEEICEAFPTSFSPAQLRAYKAHVTMGTYEEKKQETA